MKSESRGGAVLHATESLSSTVDKQSDNNNNSITEESLLPNSVLQTASLDDSTPKPDAQETTRSSKCYAVRYWLCMIFCCRPPHEMTDDEREEWEKRSFWDKYKPAFFCFIRYFIMLIIGILVGIGIFFLVLYCMGIIGGSSNNDTSNNTIDLGELQYPTVVSGYTNISITISPIAAASPYDPKDYLIETQVATGGSGGGRRLRSDGPWTVSLEVPYDKDHPTTATLTGLTADEQLLIRYKIEMEDGRVSSPSVAVMEGTKDPTAPSAPGLMAFNTTDRSVSVSIIPSTTTNGADITAYVIQHALVSSSSNDTTPDSSWTKAEVSQDDASKPYTVDDLNSGDYVIFKISAENSVGVSPSSKPYSMTTDEADASSPDQVTDLVDNGSTSNSVSLNWTAPADNGAMILRYIISEGDNTYTVDGHDTSYTVTGLSRGSDYTFYIVAKNSQGDSPKSDGVSTATTESCEADPPSNVMLQTPFSDGVSVSWSKANNNPQCDLPVTAYRVIDDDGNELCQVAATNDDDGALWCDVTGLQPSTSYNIRVQAKNSAAGWSTKSSSPVKMSTIASGKCNTRDQIRWWVTTTNPSYNGQTFTEQLQSCSVKSFGKPDKVSSCLVDYTEDPSKTPFDLPPITSDCGMCFGVNAQCSMSHCSFPCGMGTAANSAACLECNDQYCKPDFYTCSGLYPSVGPPEPQ